MTAIELDGFGSRSTQLLLGAALGVPGNLEVSSPPQSSMQSVLAEVASG
jgi:hypothetical protein